MKFTGGWGMLSTAVVLLIATLKLTEVRAQEITMEGVARSASAFAAVINICPKFFSVNVAEARKWQQLYLEVGVKAYSEKVFSEALKRELDRRYAETEITGPSQWCAYQK